MSKGGLISESIYNLVPLPKKVQNDCPAQKTSINCLLTVKLMGGYLIFLLRGVILHLLLLQ
jgi:hypothetical protein